MDPSLLPIANEIASQQANPTQKVMTAANRALSYAPARHDNCITYYACDMHLFLHVDASYLSRSHARSVVGLMLDLSLEATSSSATKTNPSTSMELPCIVSSAGEAEYAALFAGAQHAASLRNILSDLGYPQPRLLSCAIIPVLLASLPTQSNKNAPRQSTCASTGCGIAYVRGNL